MTESCTAPVSREEILDYLADALGEVDEDRLESHLFACATCATEAERLAGLLTAVAFTVPPVLSPSRFAALKREGRVQTINRMDPGQTTKVFYPESGRLLVHRLGGAKLAGARRIDLDLTSPSGEVISRFENVPFDPASGEVLVACQHHFADTYPHDIVFSVEAVTGNERKEIARYTVLHQLS
jgi:hypothetical protein